VPLVHSGFLLSASIALESVTHHFCFYFLNYPVKMITLKEDKLRLYITFRMEITIKVLSSLIKMLMEHFCKERIV